MDLGSGVTAGLYALCAAVYAALAALILVQARRSRRHGRAGEPARRSRTGLLLAGACAITAIWAVTIAWEPSASGPGGLAGALELANAVAWYGFVLHLYRRGIEGDRVLGRAFATMGLIAVLVLGVMPLADFLTLGPNVSVWSLQVAARLGLAVCNVLLVENLYLNTPEDQRWYINLPCIAIGGMFLYNFVLYADAALFHRVSSLLFQGRATATAVVAPLLAVGMVRNRRWEIDIHVSRTVVFRSASLVAGGIFLLALAAAGEVFRKLGPGWGEVAEISIVFAGSIALLVVVTSGSARSRLRGVLVDHFFTHRYDYRREWMRCIATLSATDANGGAYVGLQRRVIRVLAEVVDSPAGALLVREQGDAAFTWAGSWNMPASLAPVAADDPLVQHFRGGDWIAVFGAAADAPGSAGSVSAAPVPEALDGVPQLWLAVPLNHLGQVIGFVLLARPRAAFHLEREAFDLLRVIARQAASYVAEQHATQVLMQTRQLQEYSKRFAFVVHDVKNVGSQLSLLLANAEVHGGNPEFQRDMLRTIRSAAGRITGMLEKLQAPDAAIERTTIEPAQRLGDLVAVRARARAEAVSLETDGRSASVAMEAGAFEAVVTHLLNNAIEASAPGQPVRLAIRHEKRRVLIDIVDRGPGMSPEFVRDHLFRPFLSTKRQGTGIGAFQARELLRAAGGDLLVLSEPGAGTTMRVLLPAEGIAVAETAALSA
ncbi:MAG TPA: XrtA/PEP-CTERM system histidine kinase PrsK [Acetobacteraceae bacterium]|nr:XrtA/PEP-CTERM system histidine kinase PrsK [Acetobacteraceae bacterium]